MRLVLSLALVAVCSATSSAVAAEAFTIRDALLMAIKTHPGVGEAAANRRATESELRQTQSTLLPQVRLEALAGPEKTNRYDLLVKPDDNGKWVPGVKASVVVRQLLFDGFTSVNDIWRQAARVNSAAARVHERTELLALNAAEAYIDVVRYMRLVALGQENVAAHQKILSNVQSRFAGGRAGEGDLEQTKERVAAAQAALTEFRRVLEDSRAKFRKSVGIEPYNLRRPGRLTGMPVSKDKALAITLQGNPTIRAAQSDADAARYAFRATDGSFMPTVSLEGRLTWGHDTDNIPGHFDVASGKVVASWDIFRGGQDSWRRSEMAERYTEQTQRHARLQRDAFESVDKAWAARTVLAARIEELSRQIAADRKVISAYTNEYNLGQRSLIDLLNAENQLFNAQVSLESTRGVIVFADYQLIATMGNLIDHIKGPYPKDAEPIVDRKESFGLIPYKVPPVLLHLPRARPEPLNVDDPVPGTPGSTRPAKSQKAQKFSDGSIPLIANPLAHWVPRTTQEVPAAQSALSFAPTNSDRLNRMMLQSPWVQ